MSRRSDVLNKLQPCSSIDIHPADALKPGVIEGDILSITSMRGKIETSEHIRKKQSPGLYS
jgi:predicted molibdopterin-dependent oxidoreductase YjgC